MIFDELIKNHRVLVTCGAGGVGKTTCAAALAGHAAAAGRTTAVLTVDPARRLASALGITDFTGEQSEIRGSERPGAAPLTAMMLDSQATFDRLVRRFSHDPAQAEAILSNRFYRHFSGQVGGTHEYTAMERLYELINEARYDLIVLDTPPTVHAIDFLDAPQRLIDAFDESIYRWMIRPYLQSEGLGSQMLNFGSHYIFKTLSRFAGGEMLDQLAEFLSLFNELFSGFRERALAVQKIFKDPGTSFLVVAGSTPTTLQDLLVFQKDLARMGFYLGGFLINRTLKPLSPNWKTELDAHPETRNDPAFGARLHRAAELYESVSLRQQEDTRKILGHSLPPDRVIHIPWQDHDLSDLDGLLKLAASAYVEEK